jgi:hypothetical protein
MNDAGLVLCAERMEALGPPPIDGAPIEFVLRDLLQTAAGLKEALAQLRTHTGLRGYHVLIAAPEGPEACVVEFGASMVVREPVKGFLLGADPASVSVDEAARARYSRIAALLEDEHIIASGKIKHALADQDAGQSDPARVWNDHTKYSVVFEPRTRMMQVAFPDAAGRPGTYGTISLKGNPS